MNEETPAQPDTHELSLGQLRLLGDLLSCLDAAGHDPQDTQQLRLSLAARMRLAEKSSPSRPAEGDQAPKADDALLDTLDTAALIARSSLGSPSARRIRSLTSAAQVAEILRRRDQITTAGQSSPDEKNQQPAAEGAPKDVVTRPAAHISAAAPADSTKNKSTPRAARDTAVSRPPRRSSRWGSLQGGLGVCIMVSSAALGAIATLLSRSEPGFLLGSFVAVGAVAAALAIDPRDGWLIPPVPTIAYLVAALVSGCANDPSTVSSRTDLAFAMVQWMASGFFMMILATVLASALIVARWCLWRHNRDIKHADTQSERTVSAPDGLRSRRGTSRIKDPEDSVNADGQEAAAFHISGI